MAAIEKRKEKIQNNTILKEYERAYKRNYARLSNHRLSNEEFRIWAETASQERDKLSVKYESSPSDHIVVDFKKYLGNK